MFCSFLTSDILSYLISNLAKYSNGQALLAEGRFYSDLELTEKEIERMVMEASRAEYLANDKFKHQVALRESSTSGAEPSSSGASEFSFLLHSFDKPCLNCD